MTRVLWVFASLGVAVWTLIAWSVYGLIGLFGDVATRNADIVTTHPETVEWLSWGLGAVRNVGLAAVVLVWGVVSLLILAVPALLSFAVGRARRRTTGPMTWPARQQWPPQHGTSNGHSHEPRPGYRDVTPAPSRESDDIRRIERQ
jgi:hypothetical protein